MNAEHLHLTAQKPSTNTGKYKYVKTRGLINQKKNKRAPIGEYKEDWSFIAFVDPLSGVSETKKRVEEREEKRWR